MNYLKAFREYLINNKSEISDVTIKNYLADVKKFVVSTERLTNKPFLPNQITPEVIQRYQTMLLEQNGETSMPSSASSVKRYISSLKKFCTFLHELGYLEKNPLEKIAVASEDLFSLKLFKNYLFFSRASKATIKNYLIDVDQFLNWADLVTKPIRDEKTIVDSLNGKLIEEYKNRMLYEANFSPISINRKLSAIRKYLEFAKKQRILTQNISVPSNPTITKESNQKQPSKADLNLLNKAEGYEKNQYSRFPPLRLLQKLGKTSNAALTLLIILPLVKFVAELQYFFWKKTGGSVFAPVESIVEARPTTSRFDHFITAQEQADFKNIPKSFYAPYKLSTEHFSLIQKIIHFVRHKRPLWYKKYHSYRFAHYFHFGIILVYASMLGFVLYQTLSEHSNKEQAVVAGLKTETPRLLAFEGSINDATDTPITKPVTLRFSLYNDSTSSGSSLLWQETQQIDPDHQGAFSTVLGYNSPLSQELLHNQTKLFIGIALGNEPELKPRQQIATTDYAKNAQQVQGLIPITSENAGEKNVLLALDSSGNLTIGGKASPRFEATGGPFTLAGKTLLLTTSEGSNTNITISPDGAGIIDLQKPIQNTSQYGIIPELAGALSITDSVGILASSSTQSALLINQNGVGDLISASTSGVAKFKVDNLGNGFFAGNMTLDGNKLTTTSPIFSLFDTNVINLLLGTSATAISIGGQTGETKINHNLKVKGILNAEGGISIPQGKTLALGTTSTEFSLDIHNSQEKKAIARILNTSTSTDADGLTIKLGNTSKDTVSTDNHFLNFETEGLGEVGSIRGNGSKGIQIVNGSFADWAEYFPKDSNEFIPFGSLVCLQDDGKTTVCKENQTSLLGVASEHPTLIAGEDQGDKTIPVGLTGVVKTRVNTQHGSIKPGDLIGAAPIAGIGAKAVDAGFVAGRALEGYTNTDSQQIGEIRIALQVGWYDPTIVLNDEGTILASEQTHDIQIHENLVTDILTKIIRGVDEVEFGDNISRGSDTLASYINLSVEQILTTKELTFARIAHVKTDLISPLASDSAIAAKFEKDKFSILNSQLSSSSAVASIDNQGNARFNGSVEAAQASFSGTLRADKIIANDIEGLDQKLATFAGKMNPTLSPTQEPTVEETNKESVALPLLTTYHLKPTYATLSAEFAYTPHFATEFAQFNQGLIALGGSSLTDVAVTGQLQIGLTTLIANNSINTIGTALELQPLRQGNLSFMAGLVTIDTEGNMDVTGNARFAKDVTVEGTVATNSISIIRGVEADTSANESVATASAGTTVIKAHQKERTIATPHAKEESLIYLTATSDTQGLTPYIARQKEGSFTIQIPIALSKDISLNWWIVN